MQKLLTLKHTNEITKEQLPEALQQAIGIEIATIPVYLYTYYSVNRTPNQQSMMDKIRAELLTNGKDAVEAEKIAIDLSAEIMVLANTAGSLIMSVVVEEMLHMSLSSNVMQALFGHPKLVNQSPQGWPVALPGHSPEFPINLAPLSKDQLYTFLQIESPKPFKASDVLRSSGEPIEYDTIGQFYCMVENCIRKHYSEDDHYHGERPQLTPGRGMYTNNTINTIYYDKEHKPQFPNSEESGDLIHVHNLGTALAALQEIVEQGEGQKGGDRLMPNGKVVCPASWDRDKINSDDFDTPDRSELSHFDKFLEVYCKIEQLEHYIEMDLNLKNFDLYSEMVHDMPKNPLTINYPSYLQALSNVNNAIYSYIFIMIEECYRKDGNTQYEIFMMGIHKSMIWILSVLCGDMATRSYTDANGNTCNVGPTFENYTFEKSSSPKTQILQLVHLLIGADIPADLAGDWSYDWLIGYVDTLPDIDQDFSGQSATGEAKCPYSS